MLCVWKLLWPSKNTFCPTKQLLGGGKNTFERIEFQFKTRSNMSLRQIQFFMTTFHKRPSNPPFVFTFPFRLAVTHISTFISTTQTKLDLSRCNWMGKICENTFLRLALLAQNPYTSLAYGILVANALDLIGQPHKADGYYYWMKTHNLGFSADVCHFNQNTQRVGMASGNGK